MTDVQILAFIVVPAVAVAMGWVLAVWAARDARRDRAVHPAAGE